MRSTVREQYVAALEDALEELARLRRQFRDSLDLLAARDGLKIWRKNTASQVENFGKRQDSKLFEQHTDLDIVGFSGTTVRAWFESYADYLIDLIDNVSAADVRGGYPDELRGALETVDELHDWLEDSFRRAGGQNSQLDYQTAEEGLRRWKENAYKVLEELLGEKEAGRVYEIEPADAAGRNSGSIEEQYAMFFKHLANLKDDIQKFPHHLTTNRYKRGRSGGQPYVHASRIRELRAIKCSPFDLSRLIALCEELNTAADGTANHATAMLVRAIIDHVPPILGAKSFAQVASSYAGAKSFREAMQGLESGARKIGDLHLHTQIRSREALPTETQVNFAPQVDLLLAEIIRVLK